MKERINKLKIKWIAVWRLITEKNGYILFVNNKDNRNILVDSITVFDARILKNYLDQACDVAIKQEQLVKEANNIINDNSSPQS